VTRFLNFGPPPISGMGEGRHFKFGTSMANTSEQNMDWTSSERGQGPVAH